MAGRHYETENRGSNTQYIPFNIVMFEINNIHKDNIQGTIFGGRSLIGLRPSKYKNNRTFWK